jgi:hypothetical protein
MEDGSQCFEGRIFGYPHLLGNNMLMARFRRKIMLMNDLNDLQLNSLTFADDSVKFMISSLLFDLSYVPSQYTASYNAYQLDLKNTTEVVMELTLIFQVIIIIGMMCICLLPFKSSFSKINSMSHHLFDLIPDYIGDYTSFGEEMRVYISEV